jgi:EmrB/QacA subfamily drug resistance transporter
MDSWTLPGNWRESAVTDAVSALGAGDSGLHYASPQGRWLLATAVLGSGMAGLDATVVGIALPAIGREFAVGVDGLQWVVTAYTLTLAGLLLLGGNLGDRFGRRRMFVIGTVWFGLASALCGLAPGAGTLVLARGLQGAGGALLTPGSLALLEASFVAQDRPRAIGAWSGLSGVAAAIGPFVGGWLISAVSWRLVFFINVPLTVAVVLLTARHVPESRAGDGRGRLDVVGTVSVTAGLIALIYGLIEGPATGWTSPAVMGSLIAGIVLLGVFLLVESRAAEPLLPLGLFASAQFTAANAVTFVVYGALGGVLFLTPVALQEVAGYSPLASGAALLPVTMVMLALSARSGSLAVRIGPRLQMSVGPCIVAAGVLLLVRLAPDRDYLTAVLPAVVVFGLGLAVTVAPLTATALGAAPAQDAGVASAVNNDVARVAALIVVAVLPALTGIAGDSYLDPVQLGAGFRTAMVVAAAICLAGGLLAAVTIRNPARAPQVPWLAEGHHCGLDGPPLRATGRIPSSAADS